MTHIISKMSDNQQSVLLGFMMVACAYLAEGCTTLYLVTELPPPPAQYDAGMPPGDAAPLADSGPMLGHDAAPTPDAGSDSGTDAAVVAPALTIVFDGPAASDVLRGTQDNVMFHVTLTAGEQDLEIRHLPFSIDGVLSSDSVRGSLDTELFRDIKLKDLDTGATLMGPISMPASSSASWSSGPMMFDDAFIIHAGEIRHFGITMDVSNHEDAPGEFFAGTHAYRVTVGNTSGTFFGSSDVRVVATGEYIGASDIVNDAVIAGNAQTVVDASLMVTMAATPSLTTAVRKERDIPSVGLVFTASAADDILIRSVRLSGVGEVDGTDRASDLSHVITSCALFDGATQVGLSQAPDTVTGQMFINGVNLTVPAGTSRTLVARCTADSVVEGSEDIYSIGIMDASDIDAVRTDLFAVEASVSAALLANATISTGNFVLVRPRGIITIATDNLRQSTILVAGGDVWQNFAQYKATAQYEGVDIDAVRVTSSGDAASFTNIAVAMDGAVLGTCILPWGVNRSCDVHLDTPIHVARDGSRTFQIWGKLADVVSSTSVAPGTPRCSGYACSGARLRLGITAGVITGDWDASYSTSLNVRSTGTVSGDRLFSGSGTALLGNEFVARKSRPTFVRQSLSTTTLVNGIDADLYRFQVSADIAGSVAIAGFRFRMSMTGSGTVSSLRIRRGSTDVALADATVTFTGPPTNGYITVIFTTEQTITGSGNVYTLHGVTNGFVAGDSILTAPYRDLTATTVTGYVEPNAMVAGIMTGILWSDMIEVPHSPAFMSAGGSMDWIGDNLVEDLTQTQVLTR